MTKVQKVRLLFTLTDIVDFSVFLTTTYLNVSVIVCGVGGGEGLRITRLLLGICGEVIPSLLRC